MSLMDYVKHTLTKYATFSGRASRAEWGYWTLTMFVLNFALGVVRGMTANANGTSPFDLVQTLFGLAVLLPTIAVGVRRFHDQGRSGWLVLINLIPLVGTIIYVILELRVGQPGPNQYGPNPENPGAGQAYGPQDNFNSQQGGYGQPGGYGQ